ncbi:MAG: hypothetical protein IT168_11695 [Bryobacterales bacterium]|nr:hypothetical protein [Bryobacterales bacterium]
MRTLILLAFALPALAQNPPPTTDEVEKAYESKVSEHGSQILFWEKRFAVFTVRDIRGWNIRFKHLKTESSPGVLKLRYRALAERAGACHEYGVVQVLPTGPPPRYVKRDVQVDDLGRASCK